LLLYHDRYQRPAITNALSACAWDLTLRGRRRPSLRLSRTSNAGSSIIITSSVVGLIGAPGVSGYISSKHGQVGVTRTAG